MGRLNSYGVMGVLVLALLGTCHGELKMGFYDKTCPNAEKIVSDFMKEHIPKVPILAASFLRMHFHDCFVRGCDGSVLLNSTSNSTSEKEANPNLTLRGFDQIDRVKVLVEAECPGVVSCADILALSARDSVGVLGGPFWKVPTGRRDGSVSLRAEANAQIPAPTNNFTTLKESFANKSLSVKDLVLLSGGHTIGIARCTSFSRRLYNFTGVGDQDPSMDSNYVANLKQRKCRTQTDNTTIVEMDPGSFRTFDLSYYRLVLKRRGLFTSDAALITDSTSKSLVEDLTNGTPEDFFKEFAKSMVKMGEIDVKTGSSGEIRKHCAFVNS
ncbi:hypothetical protein AMTRI_Chr02g216240 [Amborella trichopoda]|uniref:Peroxidase n=1 Tax=Amborella trichopoda TaxID=13333 RepID=U5D4Z6_AMBTC|nr:peroxidase 3 [Amborella trichopoda]ERN17295.1 hypothetical protein AMTR_s00037p00030970 [Amborella trichopoda]|eukprot:XP_006855828.1 peroxidase 3 [Amborella trichopoda]